MSFGVSGVDLSHPADCQETNDLGAFQIAVLGMAALSWADDNLPPVPKSASRTTISLKNAALTAPAPAPTPAPAKTEATAIVKVEATVEPRCEDAPLPPIPEKTEAKNRCCHCASCEAKRKAPVVHFLANEFLRKPIYGVEKAMNDAKGRHICREFCRLERESERLTAEAARLAEKVKNCPDCVKAKLKLLEEESELAKKSRSIASDCRDERTGGLENTRAHRSPTDLTTSRVGIRAKMP
jgi:hypothetical protein